VGECWSYVNTSAAGRLRSRCWLQCRAPQPEQHSRRAIVRGSFSAPCSYPEFGSARGLVHAASRPRFPNARSRWTPRPPITLPAYTRIARPGTAILILKDRRGVGVPSTCACLVTYGGPCAGAAAHANIAERSHRRAHLWCRSKPRPVTRASRISPWPLREANRWRASGRATHAPSASSPERFGAAGRGTVCTP
jgi:hypothetical protein